MPKKINNEMFDEGETLIDNAGRRWKLGNIIGKGGFGFIYLSFLYIDDTHIDTEERYVIKIEPKSNGPLFVEQIFYQRICKKELIEKWLKENNIEYIGIPTFYGFGFCKKNKIEYRFIIIDRLGCDLNKIISVNNNKLPVRSVFLIAINIINTLKYLHNNGYTHSDIKSSNIAIGLHDKNKIYLLDYGLSYRYMINGKHVEYKRDPKKMHNGTIEFTSVDMHRGACPSRRGDLEILGYCMITWLGGKLPWEDNLKNCNYVMNSKVDHLKDVSLFIEKCLGNHYPKKLLDYFIYVNSLEYDSTPDYKKLISFLSVKT
ncbi:serine/threonine protein kinase [White-tailed deer poxvirus]|nr:serine/threonine protein kinase [White-tailed deer poxvirus]